METNYGSTKGCDCRDTFDERHLKCENNKKKKETLGGGWGSWLCQTIRDRFAYTNYDTLNIVTGFNQILCSEKSGGFMSLAGIGGSSVIMSCLSRTMLVLRERSSHGIHESFKQTRTRSRDKAVTCKKLRTCSTTKHVESTWDTEIHCWLMRYLKSWLISSRRTFVDRLPRGFSCNKISKIIDFVNSKLIYGINTVFIEDNFCKQFKSFISLL